MAKILIVDDEAIITMQLEERLSLLGYKIAGMVASGEEAVTKARQLKPDIVLMDIVMPGKINGIEAAQSIHEELDIPVIFVTAYADDAVIEKVKCVDPYGYIVKPFNELEIKAAIELALFRKDAEQKGSNRKKPVREQVPAGQMEEGGPEFIDLPEIKTVLLDDIFTDITLLLYTDPVVKESICTIAIENSVRDKIPLLFSYFQSTAQKNFLKEIQKGIFITRRLKKNEVFTLVKVFEEFYESAVRSHASSLRFLFDFSETEEFNDILAVKNLILGKCAHELPVCGVIAFHIGKTDHQRMKLLCEGVPRIIVSTGKGTSMSFAHHSYPPESLSIVPQETVNEIVKKSLEPVVLSFLEYPISGYSIIHQIHNRYKVLIPQARVYSLLYDLQQKGYLEMKTSGKSKLYFPTEKGRKYIRQKLNEFKFIFQHILGGHVDEITSSSDKN
ncbi:MAG: response regulator [Methanoregulaceae archaeon]|jgi:CheY-like chemotaxis protein/DNA-binding PadR family transcriptional regulator